MILPLVLALLAGLADLAGGVLTVVRKGQSRTAILYTTAVAAGFIVAVGILDRVPEAMTHENPHGPYFLLAGFLALYLVENVFSTHAHDAAEGHEHGHALIGHVEEESLISTAASTAALVGLLMHTLFDGIAIAAGFMASTHTGVVMFMAVIFHKLPEGFSVSALMLAAGRTPRYAVTCAGLLGVSTVLGAMLALGITHLQDATTQRMWAQALLSAATGTFLYVGCSDMIPATNRGSDRRAVGLVLLGVALFLASSYLLTAAGLKHQH